MKTVGMVVSSEGRQADVLVQDDRVETGSILRIGEFYGIVAYMLYREDEKIGSKQKLIANVQVFGKLGNNRLLKIKRPIQPYAEVFLASDVELGDMLSGERNISLGNVYGTGARAFLDPNEYDRHMAVLASTGAGKSYTTANLIKEFLSLSLPVLVVDTHGEYQRLLSHMIKEEDIDLEVYTVKYPRKGFRELKIPVSALSPEDFNHFIQLTEPQKTALETVLDKFEGDDYLLQDIIDKTDELSQKDFHEGTIRALKRKVISLERSFRNVFDKYGTDITKIIKPYQVTIIDASYAPQGVRQSVVSYLASELLQGRIREKNEMSNSIGYELLFVVEEAHNYASSKLSHSCRYQLQRIASEGRKFGVGLCVISQKPSKIDEEILSQCNTGIYMHITNPSDKDHIRRSFESINDEIIKDLDSLDVGECIIAGAMNRIPFLMCSVDDVGVKREQRRKFNYKREEKIRVAGSEYV
ncbi:MAG: ATP-binding protein [Candidatus Altiarchaeota archaeon]|nr:ATP-binding protein [Candidatus Altiarchaeota archaeon]